MVIGLMKRNKIFRNVFFYNFWMNACCEVLGVGVVESVYGEMVGDRSVEVGWSLLCSLVNVYVKVGFVEKVKLVFESVEKKLNRSNRFGYFFFIIMYVFLGDKEGVVCLWEGFKFVFGRIICVNYICVLLFLVKFGDFVEVERVFEEWEENCCNYDVRVFNVFLGVYMRNGLIREVEFLYNCVLERGGSFNYKIWEILMEGWVKC